MAGQAESGCLFDSSRMSFSGAGRGYVAIADAQGSGLEDQLQAIQRYNAMVRRLSGQRTVGSSYVENISSGTSFKIGATSNENRTVAGDHFEPA